MLSVSLAILPNQKENKIRFEFYYSLAFSPAFGRLESYSLQAFYHIHVSICTFFYFIISYLFFIFSSYFINFILLYSTVSISFHFIFYVFILFYFILFYFILSYLILSYLILSYLILFYIILYYFI